MQKLEANFHAEWQKHKAMLPEHNAAELRYFAERAKLVRPTIREKTQEEIEAFRQLTIPELSNLPFYETAQLEYDEAMRAYNKAEGAARRRSGFAKIDREYTRHLDRLSDAADKVLFHPARSVADLAVKARVHKVWNFGPEEAAIDALFADVAHRKYRSEISCRTPSRFRIARRSDGPLPQGRGLFVSLGP